MSCTLSRKRDKPLRTYGKRPIAPSDDAPSKRLAVGTGTPPEAAARTGSELRVTGRGREDQANVALPREGEEAQTHASILDYFQPSGRAMRSEESDGKREPSEEASSSPELSTAHEGRGSRLLKLRAALSPPVEADIGKQKLKRAARDEGVDVENGRRHQDGLLLPGKHACRLPGRTEGDDGTDGLYGAGAKTNNSARVQTRLNLSTRAAFTECKTCNMVWNPLYPDDARCHARRHARVARTKRREDGDLF